MPSQHAVSMLSILHTSQAVEQVQMASMLAKHTLAVHAELCVSYLHPSLLLI